MARFSEEEKAVLQKLLNDDDKTEEPSAQVKTDSGGEEFIVFRGSPDAFLKAFGVAPSAKEVPEDTQKTEETPAKEEPKPKPRSKYFG